MRRTVPICGSLIIIIVAGYVTGCGSLTSFSGVDPNSSTLEIAPNPLPADGTTAGHVRLQLRYSALATAANVLVNLATSGNPATLTASQTRTDAHGLFEATLTSTTTGLTYLSATLPTVSRAPTFTAQVRFVTVAAKLAVTTPPEATVGQPTTATVSALDSNGERTLYYDGIVAFSSTDAAAVLPTQYAFLPADNGQHAFDGVVFNTPAPQTLTVTDTIDPNLAATSGPVLVRVHSVPHLVLTGLQRGRAGTANQVQVRAVDSAGQTVADYAGTVALQQFGP